MYVKTNEHPINPVYAAPKAVAASKLLARLMSHKRTWRFTVPLVNPSNVVVLLDQVPTFADIELLNVAGAVVTATKLDSFAVDAP